MTTFELTPQLIDDFHQDGYLIVRELFDRQEIAGLLSFAKADAALADEAYVLSLIHI